MFPNGIKVGNSATRPLMALKQPYPGFERIPCDESLADDDGAGTYGGEGDLPYIKAEQNLPSVNIPAKLQELIQHCWKATLPGPNAQRTRLAVGVSGSRPKHVSPIFPAGDIRKQQARDYIGAVGPLEANPNVIARDFKLTEKLERVNAYTFRGDLRDPAAIAAAGGFKPPVTRTDQEYIDRIVYPQFKSYMLRRFGKDIPQDQFTRVFKQTAALPADREALYVFCIWWALVETESHHIGRMVADEMLKGYVSTSKYVGTAKNFAKPNGWVYTTLVRGGYHLAKSHKWSRAKSGDDGNTEQEIAFPGTVPWTDVFAFRQRDVIARFKGPLYMRQGFIARNPEAFWRVHELMSGKSQWKPEARPVGENDLF